MPIIPGPDVKQARKAQKITQQELAAEMGVTQAAVSQWENERLDMPWEKYFEAMAAIERIGKRHERERENARQRAISARRQEGGN